MQSQKISISLPPSAITFIEHYRVTKGCQSRSSVIYEALELLRERELELAYREAASEVDADWEITVGEGLGNETW